MKTHRSLALYEVQCLDKSEYTGLRTLRRLYIIRDLHKVCIFVVVVNFLCSRQSWWFIPLPALCILTFQFELCNTADREMLAICWKKCSLINKWSISLNERGKSNTLWMSEARVEDILQGYTWEIELIFFAGPWHVQKTDISPAAITEHQHLTVRGNTTLARTQGLKGKQSGSVWSGLRGMRRAGLGLVARGWGRGDWGGSTGIWLATLPGTRKPQGPGTSTVRQLD